MIVCENRTLFECIRDRSKRIGIGRLLHNAILIQFPNNVLLSYLFTILLL